jgi:acyl-CoA dehydrogenase
MKSIYGEDLERFRDSLRAFFRKEIEPNAKRFEGQGVDREMWRRAGRAGLLGVCIPPEHGGAGDDGLALVIGAEEVGYSPAGATVGAFMGTDICTLFLVHHGSEAQKKRWFPPILAGECIQCMGMTEPDAGSDVAAIRTTAIRQGDEFVVNGAKRFLSNANKADLIYLIAKTDPAARGRGMSLVMVPGDAPGVTKRRLKTMGYPGGDVGELFFDDVRVPAENLLGQEGNAMKLFHTTMILDRLMVCGRSMGNARLAFEMTLDYARQRKLFGQRVVDFQNTQFGLAQAEIDIEVGRAYLDSLITKFRDSTFTDRDGWQCKVWFSEMEGRVLDSCLQFWGGSGWMDESPISRMYTAARLQRLHAGPNELAKSILGRSYVREG